MSAESRGRGGKSSEEQIDDTPVRFDSVSKNYGTIQALNSVSFSVKQGEVFCYIGPNGAGKTTSLKILVGLIRDYRGNVKVNGISLRKGQSNVHRMLGYVPQECAFQSWRTVRQTLWTFGRLSGIDTGELDERITEVLSIVGLEDAAQRKVPHLSGGMHQKLGLAQAILHQPQLLVMDEPMDGLDPASRYQFKQVLRNLASSGVTILLSSHILSDVEDIADRIAILNKGEVIRIATPSDLQSEFQIGHILEIQGINLTSNVIANLSKLSDVEGVESISSSRCLVHLSPTSSIDEGSRAVLAALLEAKISLRSFRVVQPSLEEVYMKLIGGVVE